MKKTIYIIAIIFFVFFTKSFSQKPVIELKFTAENNGQHVSLDSILIRNLSQGGDTMLYAPDTTLLLVYVGISDNSELAENSFFVSQNYPNPFKDKTSINIYLPESDNIDISIFNLSGIEIANYENTLSQGYHAFTFFSGNEKCYFLSATYKAEKKTIKMFNVKSNNRQNSCNLIYNGKISETPLYKTHKAVNNFIFSLGNLLRYVGYAKTLDEISGSGVIDDKPQNSGYYKFDITEGIPCPEIETIYYCGQFRKTLQIGNQCWMNENLNIGNRIDGSDNMSDNGVIEKYCYDDDNANCDIYGGLYQWNEMMQYSTLPGTQGICPSGWHIPTDAEWSTIVDFLGTSSAGGKMKKAGSGLGNWWSPNTGATNEYGFTALPGGYLYYDRSFYYCGCYGWFWSSSENSYSIPWYRRLYYNDANVFHSVEGKTIGFSVRCIKD